MDEWFWESNFEPICLPNQPNCKGVQDWGKYQPGYKLNQRCLELDVNDDWKFHDSRCFEPDYFICERNIKASLYNIVKILKLELVVYV